MLLGEFNTSQCVQLSQESVKASMFTCAGLFFTRQAIRRDLAEEQQQQLWCHSGYLGSKDGRGGFRGASSSTSVSLQGPAAGRPDVSERWQVTWRKEKENRLCSVVCDRLSTVGTSCRGLGVWACFCLMCKTTSGSDTILNPCWHWEKLRRGPKELSSTLILCFSSKYILHKVASQFSESRFSFTSCVAFLVSLCHL